MYPVTSDANWIGLNNIYFRIRYITFHMTWQIKCQDWKTSHTTYRHPLMNTGNWIIDKFVDRSNKILSTKEDIQSNAKVVAGKILSNILYFIFLSELFFLVALFATFYFSYLFFLYYSFVYLYLYIVIVLLCSKYKYILDSGN